MTRIRKKRCFVLLCFFFFFKLTFNDSYWEEAKDKFESIKFIKTDWVESSCIDRCGNLPSMSPISCSCNAQCLVYRNCCEDIKEHCPFEVEDGLKRYKRKLNLEIECSDMAKVLVISSCPGKTNISKKIKNDDFLSDIFNNVPVSDKTTNLVYANKDILKCNEPNDSANEVKWLIAAQLKKIVDDFFISTFESYEINSLVYSAYYLNVELNNCQSKFFNKCNGSITLQEKCQSYVPYLLLKHIVYDYTLCQACRPNISLFSKDETFQTSRDVEVSFAVKAGKLFTRSSPWSEAECDMSYGVTLSNMKCHIVKCRIELGYYLHPDGSCRKFVPLSLSYLNYHWKVDPTLDEDIQKYVMHFIRHSLRVDVLGAVTGVLPIRKQVEKLNLITFSFLFDFSVIPTDYYLYTYYDEELFRMPVDIGVLIEMKSEKQDSAEIETKLLYPDVWQQNVQNRSQREGILISWCDSTSTKDVMKHSFHSLTHVNSTNTAICMCQHFNLLSENSSCLFTDHCPFKCYENYYLNISEAKPDPIYYSGVAFVLSHYNHLFIFNVILFIFAQFLQ